MIKCPDCERKNIEAKAYSSLMEALLQERPFILLGSFEEATEKVRHRFRIFGAELISAAKLDKVLSKLDKVLRRMSS